MWVMANAPNSFPQTMLCQLNGLLTDYISLLNGKATPVIVYKTTINRSDPEKQPQVYIGKSVQKDGLQKRYW